MSAVECSSVQVRDPPVLVMTNIRNGCAGSSSADHHGDRLSAALHP